MSIYSFSRDGVALANYLVASAFDATSSHVFGVVAAAGSLGVSLHAIAERVPRHLRVHVSVDVAMATLWRHGLIEYRFLTPLRAGNASTKEKSKEKKDNSNININNDNNNDNDDDDDDILPASARHVVVARVDVALWRARQPTHCALLAQFLSPNDHATNIVQRLFRQGTLTYEQLTHNRLEANETPDDSVVNSDDARMDRESAVALLFGLGFIEERIPLDADADRRHTIQAFMNARAPKSRIDPDAEKSGASSKAGGKRAKASAASTTTNAPPRKRRFGSSAVGTAATTATVASGTKGKAPPPPEPAVVASGALADDTDEPVYPGGAESDLPDVLKHNLNTCKTLRRVRAFQSRELLSQEAHRYLQAEQAARRKGQIWKFVTRDAEGKTRPCELNLCISPVGVALLQRLDLMFGYLKERFVLYDREKPEKQEKMDQLLINVLDAAYMIVATMSVALFAHELHIAALVSRESPCVMRRSLVLSPLPMSELVKDLKRSAKEITTALQPLIASELVEIDQQSIYFNTKLIQTSLFNETLDAHVSRAISPDARRVVALLRDKPHLTDAEIQHGCLLDHKNARTAIGLLMRADLVRFTEFPKQADFAPSRTIYLWSLANGEQLRANIRDRIHASQLRMARRLDAEHRRLNLEGVLAAGLDVRVGSRFEFDEVAEKEQTRGGDPDAEADLELLEERRRLFECGKWLERVHRKVFTVNMQLFEKLERLEANINF
jgi:transcription initiation factor IIE alpha subunit